jgi:hypothetical protein
VSSATPDRSEVESAMRKYFPDPDFTVQSIYDLKHNSQLLSVMHRAAARVVTTAIDKTAFDDALNFTDLFEFHMSSMQFSVYQDLASVGVGSEPYEPGNLHHEEIKGLCYLSGYHLLEHMPAGAETRGDAWIYLVPLTGGVADKMPPKCLALPLDFWRQLLIRKLDKHVANKSAVI